MESIYQMTDKQGHFHQLMSVNNGRDLHWYRDGEFVMSVSDTPANRDQEIKYLRYRKNFEAKAA